MHPDRGRQSTGQRLDQRLHPVPKVRENMRVRRNQAEREGRIYDRQEALHRLRQVRGGMSDGRYGEGTGEGSCIQVYRLRNLRKGVSDGDPGSKRELRVTVQPRSAHMLRRP